MARVHNYFVYILECSDKSYYVGVTNDLEARLSQHNDGENAFAYILFQEGLSL
ncbi:GIY-YIG nuclease family protein [uncultured Pedobacter sp.]|uniref:GIY-YIG nuclease family protein n=1 Tax=uncultured Pedobacter sp. TaxID=246139 RepID=UPI0025EE2E3A|nr:GIY-YIG nuclease family protein [uncultured Pedobacter sp.]